MGLTEQSRRLKVKRVKDRHFTESVERREAERKEKYLEMIATQILWPELPESDASDFDLDVFSSSIDTATLSSLDGTVTSTDLFSQSSDGTKSRQTLKPSRKQSMSDLLTPDKVASMLAKSERSIVDVYPNASLDTKDFIRELEENERRIRRLRMKPKRSDLEPGPTRVDKLREASGDRTLITSSSIPEEESRGFEQDGEEGDDYAGDLFASGTRAFEGSGSSSSTTPFAASSSSSSQAFEIDNSVSIGSPHNNHHHTSSPSSTGNHNSNERPSTSHSQHSGSNNSTGEINLKNSFGRGFSTSDEQFGVEGENSYEGDGDW
jgi:hypothetical protein